MTQSNSRDNSRNRLHRTFIQHLWGKANQGQCKLDPERFATKYTVLTVNIKISYLIQCPRSKPAVLVSLNLVITAWVTCLSSVADPGFAKGEGGRADHDERAEREPKRGSGSGAPAGSRDRAPGGGWSWKLFYTFLYKKVAKSKGFKWKFAPVSESRRYDQTLSFGQWVDGAAARSAHSWICHCLSYIVAKRSWNYYVMYTSAMKCEYNKS